MCLCIFQCCFVCLGAILPLALGLIISILLLLMVICRLWLVRRKLKKALPLTTEESDYLINGMYLQQNSHLTIKPLLYSCVCFQKLSLFLPQSFLQISHFTCSLFSMLYVSSVWMTCFWIFPTNHCVTEEQGFLCFFGEDECKRHESGLMHTSEHILCYTRLKCADV